MAATVEITEEGGSYTAVDTDSGVSASGESKALALMSLAVALEDSDEERNEDTETALRSLAERTQRRFENESITEDDVEDAIAWARSE